MEPNMSVFDGANVLITGGGGYLGSKLAQRLATEKSVICLLDIRHNELSNQLTSIHSHIHKAVVNLERLEEVRSLCEKFKPDIIYHFGALLNRDRDFNFFSDLYNANVLGTLHLLKALQDVAYKNLIFSSSSEVYGTNNLSPFKEDQLPNPASPYSLTKLMAENLIRTFSDIHKKPFIILRIFNIFAEDMPGSFFFNEMMHTLNLDKPFKMTLGEQKRDFLHIEDLLTAIMKISTTNDLHHEVINICSGKGISLKDLALNYAGKIGKEHLLQIGALDYRKNEIWEMIGDNTKMSKVIDITPRHLFQYS
jgi:nucleoside-diphosphate-sugar epimerase